MACTPVRPYEYSEEIIGRFCGYCGRFIDSNEKHFLFHLHTCKGENVISETKRRGEKYNGPNK